MSTPFTPTPEAFELFQTGLTLLLNRWMALRLAVEHCEDGSGPEKANMIISETFGWFTEYYRDADEAELAEYFAEVMSEDFHCTLEDGSDVEIAQAAIRLCNEVLKVSPPQTTFMEYLQTEPLAPITQSVLQEEPTEHDYNPEEAHVVDDDGFVTVESRTDRKNRMKGRD